MTDLHSYRAEPDAEFAIRLERELLRRLTAVSMLTEVPAVTDVPETGEDVAEIDLEAPGVRRGPSRIKWVAAGLIAAGLVAVWTLAGRNSQQSPPAVASPAANGMIAFAGNPGDGSSRSDIYVVEPDGTGLRALTSTPELVEYAPAWSPDGSRLAFVRTELFSAPSRPCAIGCQLDVVDPSTGVETFAADIPQPDGAADGAWVPSSLAWSPDGRDIVTQSVACGVGGCGTGVYSSAPTPAEACGPRGCGGINSAIADLETGTFTTFTPPYQATWSPNGEWLSLAQAPIVPGPSLLLVHADLIETNDIVDVAELPGVRPLPERPGDIWWGRVDWMPDSSALVVSGGASIDVVTVADGERRTVIADGFDPIVAPTGTQIAYVREAATGDAKEIWVAAADGSDPRRVADSLTPPAWSPDGSRLLAGDDKGWFTVRPDGTGRTEIALVMLPDPLTICCPDNRPSWQPLPAA